jgi:predicted DNA-binding transcriptional regulator AlpA
MMTEKSFPRNVNLNERAVVWVEKEIDDWLKKRIKERR